MRIRFRHFVFVVLLHIAAGCSNRDGSSIYSFQIIEENGIKVAVTTNGPRYLDPLFEFEPVLTLQEDPENEDSLLFGPREFTLGDDGNYYVNDTRNRRIAVFGADGRYLRSFGRSGNGPGEFGSLIDIAVNAGMVYIFDRQNARASRFNCSGNLINVVTIPAHIGPRFPASFHVIDDNRSVLTSINSENYDSYTANQYRIVVYSASFDTLWTVETPFVPGMIRATTSSGQTVGFRRPFSRSPWFELVHGRGIVMSGGVDPELVFYNFDGVIERKVRIELDPILVTGEDIDLERERFAGRRDDYGEQYQDQFEAQMKALVFPETKPYWNRFIVDDAGYIWLAINDPATEGYQFRILNPEGEYLGDTVVPFAGQFNVVDGKLMVIWTPPEAEGPELLICNIRPAVEGLKYP